MTAVAKQAAIAMGEKFALLAVPKANVFSLAGITSLSNNRWTMRILPMELAEHWRNWIGEIKTQQITEAGFYLLATSQTERPSIFDGDNQRLIRQVGALWDGLMITHTPHAVQLQC